MFRTSLKVAVGMLAAGVMLAGCGGPVQMGTAATIDDSRITTAQLDRTVAQWRQEFSRNPRAGLLQQQARQRNQSIPFDPDSPTRSALYQLIAFRVWTEVARRQGIAVTQGQIDDFLAGFGGSADVAASVLAIEVPLSHTTDLVRSVLIQRELLRRYGARPDAQDQANLAYVAAARRLQISVNPRFGRYDPRQVTLTPVAYRLSKTESDAG